MIFPCALTAGREYKGAIRALIPLLQGDPNQEIKLSAIDEVIPKGNGRAWRTVKEKLEHNKIASLEELDKKTRALALFIRVNSYACQLSYLLDQRLPRKKLKLEQCICSVGAKRAEKFWDDGYRTLEDLKKHSKLTHAPKVGLDYFVVCKLNKEATEGRCLMSPSKDFEALIPRS